MKKKLIGILTLAMFYACSNEQNLLEQKDEQSVEKSKLLSKEEIDNLISSSIEKTGDFDWMKTNATTIFSAVVHGDYILTVGYGNSKGEFQRRGGTSDLIKENILTIIGESEQKGLEAKGEDSLLLSEEEDINVIDVKVTKMTTIKKLLEDKRVRYIEPNGYEFTPPQKVAGRDSSSREGFGCGFKSSIIQRRDYAVVSPRSKVPWAFYRHNIPAAWNYSTGRGVTVAVLDTGVSPRQSWLNRYFNSGYSQGRYMHKRAFYVDSNWRWKKKTDGVNDKCGHGTSMISVLAAPRNNNNLSVGVAYNSNIVSYRSHKNVLINSFHEKKGVARALMDAANRRDVKVISMSLGSLYRIRRISDAVRYAYRKGKLMFAAGGTSKRVLTWYGVIFPATMNETVAVTGVKEGRYKNCKTCHKGRQIDFTIQMERNSGKKIPVLSYYNGKEEYVGGSSIATATAAGIAALVWSRYPYLTRSQVLNRLKRASDFYPNKNSDYGYGNINALKAVR